MPSALGALLEALGQGGMQIAQFKAQERNTALQRALDEDKFRQNLQLQREQLTQSGRQLDFQDRNAKEGRELQRVGQGQQQAQYTASNFGGSPLEGDALANMREFLPAAIREKTSVAPQATADAILGVPGSGGAFTTDAFVRETQPASVRNALVKAQTDAAKNQALTDYRSKMVEISKARTAIAQQATTIDAGRLKVMQDQLALAEQKADDDFNQANARIDATLYGIDSRAASGGGEDLMGQIMANASGTTYTPPVRPPAPKRPTLPTRSGGGTAPGAFPTIDDLIQGLAAYTRKGGGK